MSRQYLCAGKAVDAVTRGESFKAFCAKSRIGKVDYALACETLKYLHVLKEIIQRVGIDLKSCDVNPGIFLVMSYELLFGKKKISGGGAVKRNVIKYEERMRHELCAIMSERKVTETSDLISDTVRKSYSLPKYVRVNELKLTLQDGLNAIKKIVESATFDSIIPSLVELPASSSSFGETSLVKSGALIIQDKASCFPSQVLCDAWCGGDVIDACAAPGNKTSHMASELKKNSSYSGEKIFAFDKDGVRAQFLAQRMAQAGADLVSPIHKDFLSLDVTDEKYQKVRCILCDPSCSGSGVLRAIERAVENKDEDAELLRAAKLSQFQRNVLRKAASFPNVETIVYSTCSVHVIENEDVVANFLQENPEWDVVPPIRLSSWKRRGEKHLRLSAYQSEALIRCFPEDGMNGFFVALFQKTENHIHSLLINSAVFPAVEQKSVRSNKRMNKLERGGRICSNFRVINKKRRRRNKGIAFWSPSASRLPAMVW